MALNSPRSSGGDSVAAHQQPISRGFALVVLAALLGLVILRHLFGSIRVEAGTR